MPAGLWKALAGVIAALLIAVVGLDQWQVRQGHASLFALGRPPGAVEPRVAPPASAAGAPVASRPRPVATSAPAVARVAAPEVARPAAPGPVAGGRIAVIVDDLGARQDVFDGLRDLGRPIAVAVIPGLPLAGAMAREASRLGMEVLLDLPLEPYRYPEIDPGPGALLLAMRPEELRAAVARHIGAVPAAVGATTRLGSRLTEDRERMRAVLEPLAERGLFFVDGRASNLSVAYDEAVRLGLRAGRRHVLVDPAAGETGERAVWGEAARLAGTGRDVIVLAHAHPLTVRLLREQVSRWDAAGLRVVPVSHVVR
jgi:polysaccharide deacetylase 2 family uncharacterized protein YibQ